MDKRATYCQKVHYTYISQKTQSFKKKLRCDLYEMHHLHVRHRQWRRQLVGTWARAPPLAFKRIFFSLGYTLKQLYDLVWYYAKLLTQHYLLSRIRFGMIP